MIKIYKWLRSLYWSITDKCTECGGKVEEHINGRYYCNDCKKLN